MRLNLLNELSALDHASRRGLTGPERWHLDTPLLLGLIVVALLGLVVLYSGAHQESRMLLRQVVHLLIGFAVLFLVAQCPLHWLHRASPWLYGLGVLLLLAVLVIGAVGQGARRWLDLGVIRFQPSEIMKLAVPMMLARYLTYRPLPPRWPQLLGGAGIILLPFVLIVLQPDLGTALLVAASGAFLLFLAGIGWRLIAALGLLAAIAAPLFWQFGMHEYQRQRVLTFLDPTSDPLGSGWNIIQSQIAIGSGGLYGKGWLNSTQSRLEFLPESATDFIFAVYAEEFGLIGAAILLLLYLFLVGRGLLVAMRAPQAFARLLGGSLALVFFVYVFVNVGMVSGLLPVVGLPLPLVSYGGTALVTIMAGFGMLMRIATQRSRTPT
ncbi:MAG: rod shape-determining protein RodA [Candidatus Competibacterales bacterium]|nr:rod shape-determining protein RodA [Candidatus Competibacterales bacterium]